MQKHSIATSVRFHYLCIKFMTRSELRTGCGNEERLGEDRYRRNRSTEEHLLCQKSPQCSCRVPKSSTTAQRSPRTSRIAHSTATSVKFVLTFVLYLKHYHNWCWSILTIQTFLIISLQCNNRPAPTFSSLVIVIQSLGISKH